MNEIICPNCKKVFKVDEAGFADIVKQVRDHQFEEERDEIAGELKSKDTEKQISETALKEKHAIELKTKDDIIKMKDERNFYANLIKTAPKRKSVSMPFSLKPKMLYYRLKITFVLLIIKQKTGDTANLDTLRNFWNDGSR